MLLIGLRAVRDGVVALVVTTLGYTLATILNARVWGRVLVSGYGSEIVGIAAFIFVMSLVQQVWTRSMGRPYVPLRRRWRAWLAQCGLLAAVLVGAAAIQHDPAWVVWTDLLQTVPAFACWSYRWQTHKVFRRAREMVGDGLWWLRHESGHRQPSTLSVRVAVDDAFTALYAVGGLLVGLWLCKLEPSWGWRFTLAASAVGVAGVWVMSYMCQYLMRHKPHRQTSFWDRLVWGIVGSGLLLAWYKVAAGGDVPALLFWWVVGGPWWVMSARLLAYYLVPPARVREWQSDDGAPGDEDASVKEHHLGHLGTFRVSRRNPGG
jgi:uncharacterized membrane protein YuzA (DUF378 family)